MVSGTADTTTQTTTSVLSSLFRAICCAADDFGLYPVLREARHDLGARKTVINDLDFHRLESPLKRHSSTVFGSKEQT